MKRRLFTILSALSLVLFIATATLWMRSYGHSDYLWLRTSQTTAAPFTSPEQRAVFTRYGWFGMYDQSSAATAFTDGQCYFFFAPKERWIVRQDSPPPWITCGTDASKLLALPKRLTEAVGQISQWEGFGFSYYHQSLGTLRAVTDVHRVSVPLWLLCVSALLLPTIYIRQRLLPRRRKFRQRNGLCLTCGYDLRASPDRCPECGTPVPLPAPAFPPDPSTSDPA